MPCEWLESNEPSYVLYTSGTTGRPKGVVRDVGGYAVALAASMEYIFEGRAGDTMFTASDIGWVVGHSYIIYAPLIAGLTTVMYEGTPIRPDGGIWWRLVEQHRINLMFTAPTALRVLKKQDPALLKKSDLSSLRTLFLAGEPLDEPTASWIADALGKPVVDNYWQTETGWPMLAIQRGVEALPPKLGSPGVPVYGYNLTLRNEQTGELCAPGEKGVITLGYPLPPGCMSTVWGDDRRFVSTYWSSVPDQQLYSTFDWGIQDADGYVTILGRTDDVINVAGHRLGTREIEEALSSHTAVAEVAVVGVADPLKGQVALAFVVLRDADRYAADEARVETGGRSHRDGGPAARRDCAAGAGPCGVDAAEDALRQAAAPRDCGAGGRPRSGRSADHRRCERVAAGARCAGRRWEGLAESCSAAARSRGAPRASPRSPRLQKPLQDPVRIRPGDLGQKRRERRGRMRVGGVRNRAHDRARHAVFVTHLGNRGAFHFDGERIGQRLAQRLDGRRTGDELIAADDEPPMHLRQLRAEARRRARAPLPRQSARLPRRVDRRAPDRRQSGRCRAAALQNAEIAARRRDRVASGYRPRRRRQSAPHVRLRRRHR